MRWLDWLIGRRAQRELDELARQIAHEVRHTVWGLVTPRVLAMSPDEARGYVRVRAATVLNDAVQRAAHRRRQLSPTWRAQLHERALAALIARIEAQAQIRRQSRTRPEAA